MFKFISNFKKMEKNKIKKTKPIIKKRLKVNIDNSISTSLFPHHSNLNIINYNKYKK